MFIRNRKIRSLIFLACTAAITVQPVSWGAQQQPERPSVRNTNMPLRFTNADMTEFATTMSEILGLRPMLVDSAVQGNVDFSITISRDEIFSLFNGILKSKNAALVNQDNIYQIVPITDAVRNDLEIINDPSAFETGRPSPEISLVQPAPSRTGREPENTRTLPVATDRKSVV